MGEKYFCSHRNGGEITSGNLCRAVPCDPIGVDFFAKHDKIYRTKFCGSRKTSAGNLFAFSFIWKTENSSSSFSNSKYIVGKESRVL